MKENDADDPVLLEKIDLLCVSAAAERENSEFGNVLQQVQNDSKSPSMMRSSYAFSSEQARAVTGSPFSSPKREWMKLCFALQAWSETAPAFSFSASCPSLNGRRRKIVFFVYKRSPQLSSYIQSQCVKFHGLCAIYWKSISFKVNAWTVSLCFLTGPTEIRRQRCRKAPRPWKDS